MVANQHGWLISALAVLAGIATQPQLSGEGTNLPAIEVAQAIMVTAELDFGTNTPSIAEALGEIERRHEAADKQGRTFAILDAYGEPTADGKLHLSMHVSTEKPGTGALIFRKTGEVLWQATIVPATHAPSSTFAGKNLLLMLDDQAGKPYLLDGSNGAITVLDALVRDLKIPVREFWPDGQTRQVTFFYSACGCPVKAQVRRVGERTERVSDLPVIFPDDPAVAATIARLMRWNSSAGSEPPLK